MNLNNNIVSIVTAVYNGASYIQETAESVIGQEYKFWEWIIIDDCSTDNTFTILESLSKRDDRIKVFRLRQNSGAAAARNYGIEKTIGRYIAFIDSDDLWMSAKLNRQLQLMEELQAAFSYTSYFISDSIGMIIGQVMAPQYLDYKQLLSKCEIGCSTVMYDTKILGKQYFENPSPKTGEDYILWLKIARTYPSTKMIGVKEFLMQYRKHEGGISSNKYEVGKNIWTVYRKFERMSLTNSMFYIMKYALNGFKKHYLKS